MTCSLQFALTELRGLSDSGIYETLDLEAVKKSATQVRRSRGHGGGKIYCQTSNRPASSGFGTSLLRVLLL